ncbi:ABSCISIC ACID-INSENSITIVE 5-like protein 2 [Prunus avium]|nr:ABSCISIC ACID-INSENSITIVE 5-like protein 2 [Prunus avium]
MHFDELLKNVISVEEGQLLQNPSSSSLPASFFLGNFNLNGALSRKAADEVWKEIAHHEHVNTVVANESLQQRLSTIGETPVTPEHFLVRAGVINIGNQPSLMNASQPIMAIDPTGVVSQQTDWLQFQMAAVQQQMTMLDSNLKVSESVYENSAVNFDYSENQVGMSMPMPAISASSCESQATAVRKRHFSDEMKERTIERRQKRMIKNRESAARSRARKQAYTNQLEHEVFQLGKVNSWLKKQKEVEMILASNPISMPKYQLRRTSSAPY